MNIISTFCNHTLLCNCSALRLSIHVCLIRNIYFLLHSFVNIIIVSTITATLATTVAIADKKKVERKDCVFFWV
jgi:hypothetical protein